MTETPIAPSTEFVEAKTTFSSPDPHADILASTGIIATAKTRQGGIVNRPPQGDDVVMLPNGMTATLDTAVAHGFAVKNSDGTYRDLDDTEVNAHNARHAADEDAEKAASEELVDPLTFTPEATASLEGVVQTFTPAWRSWELRMT